MYRIEKVDTSSKEQVNEFIQLHYRLYKGTPQWVPPFYVDMKTMLNRNKHPFFEHSEGDFFVARDQKGEVVGRIAALENKPFNQVHGTRKGSFYFYDSVDDQEVTNCLFDAAMDWCHQRNLDTVVGPKGPGPFDGYGIQIEGNDQRQMMTMMNYNFPYYRNLVETYGFEKEVDFVSCYLPAEKFHLPEKIHEVARRVKERGKFKILDFKNKADLKKHAWDILKAYNHSFINNWEYWPLTDHEAKFVLDNLMVAAVPSLMKVITYNEEIVGFLLGFPDISPALQRAGGKITPWGIADMMLSLRKAKVVSLNGAGILPEYQGRGGNALMYDEMEETIRKFNFEGAEMTQVAESAVQMRKDLITAGGQPYKNHRVYRKAI
jgi:hypothetical protein